MDPLLSNLDKSKLKKIDDNSYLYRGKIKAYDVSDKSMEECQDYANQNQTNLVLTPYLARQIFRFRDVYDCEVENPIIMKPNDKGVSHVVAKPNSVKYLSKMNQLDEMIDSDLVIISGDDRESDTEVTSANTGDQNYEITNQNLSIWGPYGASFYRHRNHDFNEQLQDKTQTIIKDILNSPSNPDGEVLGPVKVNKKEFFRNFFKEIKDFKEKDFKKGLRQITLDVLNKMNITTDMGKVEGVIEEFDLESVYNKIKMAKSLNEENSDLYGKYIIIPDDVCKKIDVELKNYDGDKDDPGYEFATHVMHDPKLTYQNAKRKINLLKDMDQDSKTYQLMGGEMMHRYLEDELNRMREEVKGQKKTASKVMSNRFKKSHEKSHLDMRGDQSARKTVKDLIDSI